MRRRHTLELTVRRRLLPGERVRIRSALDIAATLTADQALDGLPFMPEMLEFCGRTFRVQLRAGRTCVVPPRRPLPRLMGAVVLGGLRCTGAFHGGCQLGCMLLWKEEWLTRNPERASGTTAGADEQDESEDPHGWGMPRFAATRGHDPDLFFCQGTELPRATVPGEPLWNPRQYVRFLRDRTFTMPELVGMFARPVVRRLSRLLRPPARRAPLAEPTVISPLMPGDVVRIRSAGEIRATLDSKGKHRGLGFGGDMYAQCGRTLAVQARVEKVIDERTGHLRTLSGTVILDGSVCDRYLGCARGMPLLWRDEWLERVPPEWRV